MTRSEKEKKCAELIQKNIDLWETNHRDFVKKVQQRSAWWDFNRVENAFQSQYLLGQWEPILNHFENGTEWKEEEEYFNRKIKNTISHCINGLEHNSSNELSNLAKKWIAQSAKEDIVLTCKVMGILGYQVPEILRSIFWSRL